MISSFTKFKALALICHLFTNAVEGTQNKMIPQVKALSDDLLKNYSKHILPSETFPFHIKIQVDLLGLGEIDELEEKMSSVFWFYYTWNDDSIKWNENQTNIGWIALSYNDVWTPVVKIANPHADVSKSQSVDRYYDVVFYSSKGKAFYDEMMTTRTTCDLDMSYYPFDIQMCSIELVMVGSIVFRYDIDASIRKIIPDKAGDHGSWRLLNKTIITDDGGCNINMVFERKPLFLLINIFLPIIVLALLTPVVFVLPKKSGERVGYAITMLLAISVYMTIVSDNLPKNSQPMPLVSIMIFILYILDAIIVFIVIVNTKIHTMKHTIQIPCIFRNFVILTQKLMSLVTCEICRKDTSKASDEKETCLEHTADNNTEKHKTMSDSEIDEKMSDSEKHISSEKVTWQDVSKSIDKWSFVVCYLFKIILPIVFLSIAKTKSKIPE